MGNKWREITTLHLIQTYFDIWLWDLESKSIHYKTGWYCQE